MPNEVSEIELTILIGSILGLSLVSLIVLFLFFYQKKYFQQESRILKIKEQASQEILKAQLEIREITLNEISKEIHDNSGQILSLIKLNTHMLIEKYAQGKDLNEMLLDTKSLIINAITDLRNLSRSISSDTVEHLGFALALSIQFEKIKKLNHFQTSFEIIGSTQRFPLDKEIVIFRMCQEILQNIMKHSMAKNLNAQIIYQSERLIIDFQDDGIGFDVNILSSSYQDQGSGLENLRRRSKLIGANLEIISNIGSGTKIMIQLPY